MDRIKMIQKYNSLAPYTREEIEEIRVNDFGFPTTIVPRLIKTIDHLSGYRLKEAPKPTLKSL